MTETNKEYPRAVNDDIKNGYTLMMNWGAFIRCKEKHPQVFNIKGGYPDYREDTGSTLFEVGEFEMTCDLSDMNDEQIDKHVKARYNSYKELKEEIADHQQWGFEVARCMFESKHAWATY